MDEVSANQIHGTSSQFRQQFTLRTTFKENFGLNIPLLCPQFLLPPTVKNEIIFYL